MHFIRMTKSLHESSNLATWPANGALHILAAADAAEVHELLVISYARGGGTVPPFETWWTSLIDDAEFDANLCFLVRNDTGDLIAFAHCWTTAFIKDLVVHPNYRRQGFGHALLLHIFSVFKASGGTSVSLKVQSDNVAAIQLYGQAGMTADV
jgi:ribosomal protein S18 acetylase RimI-like enzyme